MAPVAGAEDGERLGVTSVGADEVVRPAGAVGVGRGADDGIDCGVCVDVGVTEGNLSVAQQSPAATGTAIGHADTAGVHDEAAVDETHEWHVGVAAHDGALRGRKLSEHLGPPFEAGVDKYDLVVAAGCAVAEHGGTRVVEFQHHRMGQLGEQTHVRLAQLFGGPPADFVGNLDALAACQRAEFAVGVASYQNGPVTECQQLVEHSDRLGPAA